jgi:hypothetical protein
MKFFEEADRIIRFINEGTKLSGNKLKQALIDNIDEVNNLIEEIYYKDLTVTEKDIKSSKVEFDAYGYANITLNGDISFYVLTDGEYKKKTSDGDSFKDYEDKDMNTISSDDLTSKYKGFRLVVIVA